MKELMKALLLVFGLNAFVLVIVITALAAFMSWGITTLPVSNIKTVAAIELVESYPELLPLWKEAMKDGKVTSVEICDIEKKAIELRTEKITEDK